MDVQPGTRPETGDFFFSPFVAIGRQRLAMKVSRYDVFLIDACLLSTY
jgi:hypothetical protein